MRLLTAACIKQLACVIVSTCRFSSAASQNVIALIAPVDVTTQTERHKEVPESKKKKKLKKEKTK